MLRLVVGSPHAAVRDARVSGDRVRGRSPRADRHRPRHVAGGRAARAGARHGRDREADGPQACVSLSGPSRASERQKARRAPSAGRPTGRRGVETRARTRARGPRRAEEAPTLGGTDSHTVCTATSIESQFRRQAVAACEEELSPACPSLRPKSASSWLRTRRALPVSSRMPTPASSRRSR